MTQADAESRRAVFRGLHENGCFAIPNPFDRGTARYLRSLGFPALATTSSGFAFSRGFPDEDWAVPLDAMLAHIADIASSVDLPVNADFKGGFADEPEDVAENVRHCAGTGVAGLSIEDSTGNPIHPLYDLPLAVERIRAARAALDRAAPGVMLTARAECYLVGHPDPLRESIRRLEAYAEAGADVLYAPGPRTLEEIREIVSAAGSKPVNALMGVNAGLRMADLAGLGVRRVSVGSSLARAAWTGFIHAAKLIAEEGSFAGFDGTISFAELNEFFRQDAKSR